MATISRLNRSLEPSNLSSSAIAPIVPGAGLLRCLGIEAANLANDSVTVRSVALVHLLREIARQQPFDPDFYAENYPDIEAARLAGTVTDLHVHFIESGFIEGRLPCLPPFDPDWYSGFYPDLADVFAANDADGLRNHFLSAGLAEGRAGTAGSLPHAAQWVR